MKEMKVNPFSVYDKDWAIVTAGTPEDFNGMTISWGSTGTIWNKPIVTVYVKPSRYTYNYLKNNDYFTVCWLDDQHKAEGIMGTRSGRDTGKVKEAGLTPVYLEHGVTYQQAVRTLVCRKIYVQQLDGNAIPQEAMRHYSGAEEGNYHTMFIGEVIDVLGE